MLWCVDFWFLPNLGPLTVASNWRDWGKRSSTDYNFKFKEELHNRFNLTLKGPGFFVYLKSGGGRIPPPPQISAAERRKILKFGTYVEFINTHMLTKLQCWKSNRFLIMQIYVNYMHVLLFFMITDKMRPFRAFKMFWYCHRNI